jgi:hypothetical protein
MEWRSKTCHDCWHGVVLSGKDIFLAVLVVPEHFNISSRKFDCGGKGIACMMLIEAFTRSESAHTANTHIGTFKIYPVLDSF